MAYDSSQPSMTSPDWATALGSIRENFRALKDDGIVTAGSISGYTFTGTGTVLVLSASPTITTPIIASFANSNHNHTNSAGGGQLTDAALSAAVGVAKGGTGATSVTAYAVLCGGTTTTGALQSIASVGTIGQILTSNGAGALPTFQTAATGSLLTALTTNSSIVANSTAFIASGLSLTLAASSTYVIEAFILANPSSTGGSQVRLNGTVGVSWIAGNTDLRDNSGALAVGAGTGNVYIGSLTQTASETGTISGSLAIYKITATVVTTTSGSLIVEFTQAISASSGLYLNRGSWLRATKV